MKKTTKNLRKCLACVLLACMLLAACGTTEEPLSSDGGLSSVPDMESVGSDPGDPVTTETTGTVKATSTTTAVSTSATKNKTNSNNKETTSMKTTTTTAAVQTAPVYADLTKLTYANTSEYTASDVVKVAVRNSTLFKSNMTVGATHTHYHWEKGNSVKAVKKVETMFKEVSSINNQHIMGFGAGVPWPKKDGPYDFASLDYRINYLKTLGGELMITLCQAPGWMKGTDDWEMGKAVLDEYVDDFAKMCGDIAARYKDVKYFQIWNEFKGYWDSTNNSWDAKRYTTMYNKVYAAVKKARPDAKVGGFYMVICGDDMNSILGKNGPHGYAPFDSGAKSCMQYWLDNMIGADFICIDKGLRDYHNQNVILNGEETVKLSQSFQTALEYVKSQTDLPIIMSEFYGTVVDAATGKTIKDVADAMNVDINVDYQIDAAQYASMYYYMMMGSAGTELTTLHWVEERSNLSGNLFTDTVSASKGGNARLTAQMMGGINTYFKKGVPILKTEVSSSKVLALATNNAVMLINQSAQPAYVSINGGKVIKLIPFDVRFVTN